MNDPSIQAIELSRVGGGKWDFARIVGDAAGSALAAVGIVSAVTVATFPEALPFTMPLAALGGAVSAILAR